MKMHSLTYKKNLINKRSVERENRKDHPSYANNLKTVILWIRVKLTSLLKFQTMLIIQAYKYSLTISCVLRYRLIKNERRPSKALQSTGLKNTQNRAPPQNPTKIKHSETQIFVKMAWIVQGDMTCDKWDFVGHLLLATGNMRAF